MENEDRKLLAEQINKNAQSYYFTDQQTGIDNRTKKLVMGELLPYIKGPKILELGFVDGLFTDMLLDHDPAKNYKITLLEGAEKHIRYAQAKYRDQPQITIIHDYFETFRTTDTFDTLVAGDMIQYLADPISFFKKAQAWLNPAGVLLVTTPNLRSFHRRIGTYLGLVTNPESVTAHERSTGNIRMYDNHQLQEVLSKSGWQVHFVRGSFLKPLSSKQIEQWDDKLLKAFLAMGNELGDYAWFLIAYCTKH